LLSDKGTVFTWGWGEHGQLGLGDTSDHVAPQRVDIDDNGQRMSGSLAVHCGSRFTIAVNRPSGWLFCNVRTKFFLPHSSEE